MSFCLSMTTFLSPSKMMVPAAAYNCKSTSTFTSTSTFDKVVFYIFTTSYSPTNCGATTPFSLSLSISLLHARSSFSTQFSVSTGKVGHNFTIPSFIFLQLFSFLFVSFKNKRKGYTCEWMDLLHNSSTSLLSMYNVHSSSCGCRETKLLRRIFPKKSSSSSSSFNRKTKTLYLLFLLFLLILNFKIIFMWAVKRETNSFEPGLFLLLLLLARRRNSLALSNRRRRQLRETRPHTHAKINVFISIDFFSSFFFFSC